MIDTSVLKPGERFDDLERNGYHIIQNPEKFCFGMDAVLLSGFTRVKPDGKVLDMCTGTGIIPILLAAKTPAEHIYAMEIQPESADMAKRSVEVNGLSERITVEVGDIKQASEVYGRNSMDVVTCNPPYMPFGKGLANPESAKAIARHEVLCTLEDVCLQASAVLKEGGHFFMVHRPSRLVEIMLELTANRLEPKRMKFVQPFADKKPNMVLIEAVKGGGRQLIVEEPVIVFSEPGVYSDEIKTVYGY
ncbi:MAG: tRNA1(Val) (adenine(37)-N6)-methyltransferase [Lachnospiraceae bacterium]